jgi:SAM-dependent methyltransferase
LAAVDGKIMGETAKIIIPESDIRRHGPGNLLGVCWRQWRAERALARRRIHFRSADLSIVATAYAAMTEEEFDAINGRQDWANWRTIPRCLSGHVPNRPLLVLDLGCGTGGSTRALAFYCPRKSRIIGYELAEPLVAIALQRKYVYRDGAAADVSFRRQGVTEPLCDVDGQPLPDETVGLVNASGIVGHHLHADTVQPLIQELQRVLVSRGIAMLDVGPTLGARELTRLMNDAGFRALGRFRSWLCDPTGQVVYAKERP